ncbi:MAG: chromate resistance protein [Elusimicrobia bacterium]|nr:chromate resistance protein [Elusimicrobiota bacterium]
MGAVQHAGQGLAQAAGPWGGSHQELSGNVLSELAEIIHDIDLKDGKFGRPEAHGVGLAVQGICRIHKKDADRLTAGIAFFDAVRAAVAAKGEKKSHA